LVAALSHREGLVFEDPDDALVIELKPLAFRKRITNARLANTQVAEVVTAVQRPIVAQNCVQAVQVPGLVLGLAQR